MTEGRRVDKRGYGIGYVSKLMAEQDRVAPIPDGKVKGSDNKMHDAFICPCCGNPVTRFHHKYSCGACRQRLLWPGVDYEEYDRQEMLRRKEGYVS